MNYRSTTNNQTLMFQARKALKEKWGLAMGCFFIFILLSNLSNNFFSWRWIREDGGNYKVSMDIIWMLICGPITLGYTTVMLQISRNQTPKFEQLFHGFKRFGVALGTFLLSFIFIILWMLLLVIPGIIAILRYSQIWFILSEDENIGPLDAINKSKEMMLGNKLKLFYLYCRFFGWFILCLLTLGLGFIVLGPYMSVSGAKFYDDLKNDVSIKNIETTLESQESISENTPEHTESIIDENDGGT